MPHKMHKSLILLASTLAVLFQAPASSAFSSPYSPNEALGPRRPHGGPSAAEIIAALNLTANPEKGYFAQTFADAVNVTFTAETSGAGGAAVASYETVRAASTAIYYLLEGAAGDSLWHRIDAAEVWHHYAGAPLRLRLSRDDGGPLATAVLGPGVLGGQRPQVVVGRWQWQSARSLGEWTLVGTTGELTVVVVVVLLCTSRGAFGVRETLT